MGEKRGYLKNQTENTVLEILTGIDRDVERGEDVLMLGRGVIMLSSTFAPIAPPPTVIAITFAISSGFARKNYLKMERKILESMMQLVEHEKAILYPITAVFVDYPSHSLRIF